MAGPHLEAASAAPSTTASTVPGPAGPSAAALPTFTVTHQDVELDVDFAARTLAGKATLTIQPLTRDMKGIRLCARQMDVKAVSVEKHAVGNFTYRDSCARLRPPRLDGYGVQQHHLVRRNVDSAMRPAEPELWIPLPRQVRVKEVGILTLKLGGNMSLVPLEGSGRGGDDGPVFRPITLVVHYVVREFRDGVQWVGMGEGDVKFPHLYTYNASLPGSVPCFVFPHAPSGMPTHTWRFTIQCPRTLADIFPCGSTLMYQGGSGRSRPQINGTNNGASNGGGSSATGPIKRPQEFVYSLTDDEKAMEISVVCSGYMEDSDAPIEEKTTKRKWVFACNATVSPEHVGFAVGPFEQVDLSQFRESDQDEKLGQSAVRVHGFCLPGRSAELRNTCMPLPMAMDKLTTTYGSYPFESESTSYKVCFVDDLPTNVVDTATLSICSSRLLVPENIWDTLYDSSRELIHAVASQWVGVHVTPKSPRDFWLIVGCSYFMTDHFIQTLWGKNEYRFRQKMAADKIHQLDVKRPSLYELGAAVTVDEAECSFLKLKAPVVMFILHQRLLKASGRNGVDRIVWRMLLDVKVGKLSNEVDTEKFLRICERVAHTKLDGFFNQWVFGAGCPSFRVTQRFNKKKLVVEMLLQQVQSEQVDLNLDANSFMLELKEHQNDVLAEPVQRLFTGPMTIRIHEADGTPYEHIVDIKEVQTKVEIPYNTKYKRLKRNRRQKERAAAAAGVDITGEGNEDVLVYCLGDVLQTEEEMRDWKLVDWTKEDEDRMAQESYEWIRLDKDFEWITKITFNQPPYMWVSQLQQDNDIVAQVESIQYMLTQHPFPIVSTILLRTLMDSRYYYGLRVMAALALSRCATEDLEWLGLFHLQKAFEHYFCFDNSVMTRSNDFSDIRQYKVQCAIPRAISAVRDNQGRAPDQVKKFFIDKLKFNDNTNNEYSDSFYVSTLMSSLAQSLISTSNERISFSFDDMDREAMDAEYQKIAVDEIQRFLRIDEWIPSFQNEYTVTALESIQLLMQHGIVTRQVGEFMKYTQRTNSPQVRAKAFECLIDLDMFASPPVIRYFLQSFLEEPSAYMRNRLWSIIGRGLGKIALANDDRGEPMRLDGALVIESDAQQARQTLLANKGTLESAVAALKTHLSSQTILEESFMDCLRSPLLSLSELSSVLSLCSVLFDTNDSLIVKLKYPRYWQARHIGRGKLVFSRSHKCRTKPSKPLVAPMLPTISIKSDGAKRSRPTEASASSSQTPDPKRRKTGSPGHISVTNVTPSEASIPKVLSFKPRNTLQNSESNSNKATKPHKPSQQHPPPGQSPKPVFRISEISVSSSPELPKNPQPTITPHVPTPSRPPSSKKSLIVILKLPNNKSFLRRFPASASSQRSNINNPSVPPSHAPTPPAAKTNDIQKRPHIKLSKPQSPPAGVRSMPPPPPLPPLSRKSSSQSVASATAMEGVRPTGVGGENRDEGTKPKLKLKFKFGSGGGS